MFFTESCFVYEQYTKRYVAYCWCAVYVVDRCGANNLKQIIT